MENDGWVRDPDAIATVRALCGWKEGDEVEVDTKAWAKAHNWGQEHAELHPMGFIDAFTARPNPTPRIRLGNGAWYTAHEFIIAWRPKRG